MSAASEQFAKNADSPNTLCGVMLHFLADPENPARTGATLTAVYSHAEPVMRGGSASQMAAEYEALKAAWSSAGLVEIDSREAAGCMTGSRTLINPGTVLSIHACKQNFTGLSMAEIEFNRYLPETGRPELAIRNLPVVIVTAEDKLLDVARTIAAACPQLTGLAGSESAAYAAPDAFQDIKLNGPEISGGTYHGTWGRSASIGFASEADAAGAYRALREKQAAASAPAVTLRAEP